MKLKYLSNASLTALLGLIKSRFATKDELAEKQDKLTFDSTPTAGSTNPVTSGGVKSALDNYLTTSNASSTYATKTSLNSYLKTSDASSTYATKTSLDNYLTTSNASSTYVKKTDLDSLTMGTEYAFDITD